MPGEDLILSDAHRAKLDDIVKKMSDNKESDKDIQFVVDDFKTKYGEKKNAQNETSPLPSASSTGVSASEDGDLVPSGIDYLKGQNFMAPAPVPLQTTQNPVDMMRAAGTSGDITPSDQTNFNPDIAKAADTQAGPIGNLSESFQRGAARLGGSLLKAPGFLYDITAAATNNVLNRPLGLNDLPTAKQIGESVPDELNATKDLDKAVSHSEENFQNKYDKGVTEYFQKGDYNKGFGLLANSIAETAPTTIALIMGNAAGLSTAGSVGAGGAVFGAEKMSQLEKENPNISQEQKLSVAAANGLLEGAFEQFGLTKLGGITKEIFKKQGVEAAKKVAEEGFKKSYGKVLKQYLGTSAEEALSEAATQFAQNAVDKYSGVNPDLDLKNGVVDAAIIGLGAGTSMSAPTSLLSLVKTKKAIQQASDMATQKETLENDLQSPDVSEEAKAAISKKVRELNEQEADMATEEKKKFEDLTDEGKNKVHELLNKMNGITTVVTDQNISDETREGFKKDLDSIDDEIHKVYETEKKPKDAEKDNSEEDTKSEIEYLNELKNSFGLEEPEIARLIELQSKQPFQQEQTQEQPASQTQQEAPVEETPATETGLAEGESKSEPIDITNLAPEPINSNNEAATEGSEDINQQKPTNENKTEETNQAEKTDKIASEEASKPLEKVKQYQTPAVEEIKSEAKPKAKNNELMDEEADDENAENAKDLPEAKEALDKDIQAMKQMKTEDLAQKKFIGMVERAWKAKEEGKISRKTYTEFRNKAKDILEGKVRSKDGIDATEAKLKSTAAINKVREKLLGQGYKKITLSTLSPITPQTVDDFLTLANKLIHRGIDAGYTIHEATQKALSVIKKHPAYKRLLAEKKIDEKAFDDSVNDNLKQKETKKSEPKTEKNISEENTDQPDEISGEKRKKKTLARLDESERLKDIAKEVNEDDKFYKSVKASKARIHIDEMLDQYQKDGLLENLAKKIIDGKSPFHPKISQWAAAKLSDRLRVLAENEGNEMQKSAINKLAGKLWSARSNAVNLAATITGLESEVAKELPLSEEGLREIANGAISNIQDTYLSEKQKKEITQSTKSINEILESEETQKAIRDAVESEINKIAEATNGKEWVDSVNAAIDSLKIDLNDC